MEPTTEFPQRADIVAHADRLAAEHSIYNLWNALWDRLQADGRAPLAELLQAWWSNKGRVQDMLHPSSRARTLVAHLHMVGRGELAEALRALLHGPELAPQPADSATISGDWPNWLDAHRSPVLDLDFLGRGLVRRLRSDGVDLADAVEAVLGLTSPPLVLDARPYPAVGTPDEAAGVARAERVATERLAAEQSADALCRALMIRLHAEGHHAVADLMLESWMEQLVGARVDAGKLAAMLIASLAERGRGDLAAAVTALLRGVDFPPTTSAHPALPPTLTPEVLSWLGVHAAPDLHPRAIHADLTSWLKNHGRNALSVRLHELLQPVVAPTLEDLRRSNDPYFDGLRERLEKMETES